MELFKNISDIENSNKIKELEDKYNSLSNENKIKVLNSLNNMIIAFQNIKSKIINVSTIKDDFEVLKDNLNSEDVDDRLKKLRSKFY